MGSFFKYQEASVHMFCLTKADLFSIDGGVVKYEMGTCLISAFTRRNPKDWHIRYYKSFVE